MTTPHSEKLLRCPFCGAQPMIAPPMDDGTGVLWHADNGCILGTLWFPTDKWNTRAQASQPKEPTDER